MPAEPITDQQVKLLTVPELAHLLSVPASWVYAKVEAGELPHEKHGRYIRFDPAVIAAYRKAQRRGPSVEGGDAA